VEDQFNAWSKAPTPDNMASLLEAANPVLDTAVKSYAGGDPAFRSRAKLLAADAFRTYDPAKGTKLRTHLLTQLQSLRRHAMQRNQVVKVPERVQTDMWNMHRSQGELNDKLGREPSEQELADHSGLSMKRLRHVREFASGDVAESGLTTRSEDGEAEMFHPGTQQADPEKIWMEYVHHELPPMDRQILEWRTGMLGRPVLSNNEIAGRLRLSAGAVSQRAAKIAARVAEGREFA
jgi:RNA polymerase primary sigma factor